MSHHGVLFPAAYVPTGAPVGWRQRWIRLSPLAEEYALMYARLKRAGRTDRVFDANFWADWKRMLPRDSPITSLQGCDFSKLLSAADEKGTRNDGRLTEKYRTAIVDGVAQPVDRYRIDAPGIFMGRAEHPLRGRIKRRITAADVTLNLGASTRPPPPGGWKRVISDPFVDWLASWKDPLLGTTKYMRLAASSTQEQSTDRDKFDRARRFANVGVRSLMRRVRVDLGSEDAEAAQLATCSYLLERMAIRVGRSDDDDRARGLTSLNRRHMRIIDGGILFDFIGKDGIPYRRTIRVPDKRVLENVACCLHRKGTDDRVFDRVCTDRFNDYVRRWGRGDYTAKDFRTRKASADFEGMLLRLEGSVPPYTALMLAGAAAAYACNHRVGPPPYGMSDDDIESSLTTLSVRSTRVASVIRRKIETVVRDGGLSLSTSRDSYVDPRISMAYCARNGLSPDVAFPGRRLLAKFAWALPGDARYRFIDT